VLFVVALKPCGQLTFLVNRGKMAEALAAVDSGDPLPDRQNA
jgi:hypothetical protein